MPRTKIMTAESNLRFEVIRLSPPRPGTSPIGQPPTRRLPLATRADDSLCAILFPLDEILLCEEEIYWKEEHRQLSPSRQSPPIEALPKHTRGLCPQEQRRIRLTLVQTPRSFSCLFQV